LGILVWTPDDVPNFKGQHRNQLLIRDASSWSAVTLEKSGQRVIVVNSTHSEARQNNNIMHELAHLVLEHEAARVDISPQGLMLLETYNLQQEAEADWLAGALLVPREALLAVLKRNQRLEAAAAHFQVSVQLVRMRRDRTGISRQLSYQRAS
jgi:Zn-dependent peptidase ImmA (M78 family)